MNKQKKKLQKRRKRKLRVRNKISGTKERPRLCVFRSLKHTYCQLIDDIENNTIVSCSTLTPELREKISNLKKDEVVEDEGKKKKENVHIEGVKTKAARLVGERIAEMAIEKGIKKVVFDRGHYLYHGRVKKVAEGVRAKGLNF